MSVNICIDFGANLGKGNCPVRMKYIKHLIPTGNIFSDADMKTTASFKAALKAAMLLIIGSTGKAVVFPKVNVPTDNTGDNDVVKLADGYGEVLIDKLPTYSLESVTDYCTNVAMTAFNGYLGNSMVVDGDNVLWWIRTDTDVNRGFSIGNINTPVPRFGSIGAIQTAKTQFGFGSVDEFLQAQALKLDFDVATLTNQVTMQVTEIDTRNTNVFYLSLVAVCSGIDAYEDYATVFANAARWSAKGNGAPLTLTSVAKDETNTTAVTAASATRTITITAVGADNDTINVGPSGLVTKTSSESTVTLLAAKIVSAINASTSTNGGYTASNVAGVITETAPTSLGASLNTTDPNPTIVGTITTTHTAWTGGVTGVAARTATNKGWKIIADPTEFGALAQGTLVEINIKDPTTLATASIFGVEGKAKIYTL